ncbi:MAG TPA: exodeoxyribonuclease VII large subunit [Longimicrobiales bacterium]|nr:exodeoxyribonuclease VII large subunit [Longimicrobiales bacterium]
MTEHDGVLDLFSGTTGQEKASEPKGASEPEGASTAAYRTAPTPPVPDAPRPEAATPEPEGEGPTVLRVSELNRLVREHLEGHFTGLWVSGEVSNWKRAGSGHCYFSLRDDAAEIRCVLWRSDAARLPMDPDDGMEVRLFGDLTLYEARGAFQLRARKLEAAGEDGLWRLAFERLRTRLDEEGLLAPERKRPLPRYPRTVGVVTSTSGAALRDILSVMRRRAPWTRVLVRNARVQGEGAAREIADGIRFFALSGGVDVVIVGRGGGSVEDLWAFNEEAVARAIAACPIPVVSAVGHEVDVTISDLVADHRAPTPSAAAEAVVPDADTLREQLGRVRTRLRRALQGAVDVRRRRLADGPRRLARALQSRTRPLEEQVGGSRRRLDRAVRSLLAARSRRAAVRDRLLRALEVRIGAERSRLHGLAGRLQALSPLATLERGYAIPLSEDGRLLRGTGDFTPDADFRLRVRDGQVEARVLGTTPEEATGPNPTTTEDDA